MEMKTSLKMGPEVIQNASNFLQYWAQTLHVIQFCKFDEPEIQVHFMNLRKTSL